MSGLLLAHVRALAVEHEVGREGNERQAALPARLGHETGEASVHELGFVGASRAEVRAAQHRGVHDGLRARLVHEARDRCRVHEVGRDRAQTLRRASVSVDSRDVEPALVQQGRQAPAEQAARAGDEDAQRPAQPIITAPPLTDRIWPCR